MATLSSDVLLSYADRVLAELPADRGHPPLHDATAAARIALRQLQRELMVVSSYRPGDVTQFTKQLLASIPPVE